MVKADRFERQVGVVNLAGVGDSDTIELDFSDEEQSGRFLAVRVTRTRQAGTAYTVNSLDITISDRDPAAGNYNANNKIMSRLGKEPGTDGSVFNETDVVFGTIVFYNRDASYNGKMYVTVSRLGGAANSEEDYEVVVDLDRKW